MLSSQAILLVWWGFVHYACLTAQILNKGAQMLDRLQLYDNNQAVHSTGNSAWTAAPQCLRSPSDTEDICVYTSTSFANQRGISIVTSSTQAAKLLQLPSFTNSDLLSALGVNELRDPPFGLVQSEGRGIGLVANRTIRRGEWLMSFTPALMILKDATAIMPRAERLSLQRLALDQLPRPLRHATSTLYSKRGNALDDHLDDILDTNAFQLPLVIESRDGDQTREIDYKFLFPEIARFNHACRPTADYVLDSSLLVLHVIAFRDVLPGEELTITYIDPLQKYQARQKALRKSWGFTCSCAKCAARTRFRQASDARIDAIMELQDVLVDRETDFTGSPELAERLISLLQQEQLWTLVHDGYFAAAIEHSKIGNAAEAQRYANLALQSRFLCRGTDVVDDWHQDMQSLSVDPQRHPSWMFRVPK